MAEATNSRRAATAFPTSEESLALQASLLDGDRAIEAWRKLRAVSGPEEPGISWIAPLLMANLSRLLPQDRWVLDNPHYLTLCHLKGRAITECAQTTLHFLEQASVPTMALKGLALGASVYASAGLRSVSDLDILVPRKDLFRAMEGLKGLGLRPGLGEPQGWSDLRARHAHPLYPKNQHETTIDLHWHVLQNARGDEDDAIFWTGALPLRVGSASTLALCAEDQLLHVLVHGVRWTRVPHVRWAADAALIFRASGATFRMERFLQAVNRFDVVTPVQEGLRFVVETLGEGAEVFERARSLKRSRFSERAFRARATAYQNRSVTDRIAMRIESAVWSRRASRRAPRKPGTGH